MLSKLNFELNSEFEFGADSEKEPGKGAPLPTSFMKLTQRLAITRHAINAAGEN